jgi:hypothetical protein
MTPIRDPHRVLDLCPGATQGEILAAYMRLRRAFRTDSPALLSLDCEDERRSELAAIEQAFRALSRTPSLASIRPARPPATQPSH